MKKTFFLLLLLGMTTLLYSQVDKTSAYFQQEVNTTIHVTLDDVSHILRGDIKIEYTNHSPDTLNFIYFHLWPNAYSSDRTAYNRQAVENNKKTFYLADKNDWGFIDSLDFKVDGRMAKLVPTDHKDVVKLMLNEPLIPGDNIEIFTPFFVQIPSTFSRLGHHGQSYQITQWFPKPAVYDKNGWHPMPYLDQGEFYSEFGKYDVSITLPKNYILMATGNLQTESEKAFLDSLASLEIKKEITPTPASHNEMKTVRYTEENIHDFAWFADKRWVVRKGEIKQPLSKLKVEAWSAFYPEHLDGWKNSIDYLRSGILGYSKEVGQYPYKTVKAVEGPLEAGGGMEYPTITIIIPSDNPDVVENIIVHEVGHNWFYGILANNERRFPWMDESINSYYENKILKGSTSDLSTFEKLPFLYLSNSYNAQALNLPANEYKEINYGADIYQRGAYAFEWLNAYIGPKSFSATMKDIFNDYKFKHVQPEDFRSKFSSNTDKDVSWFFDEYLSTSIPIDFKIKKVKETSDSVFITIKNKTHVNAPAIIDAVMKDNEEEKIYIRIPTVPFTDELTIRIPKKNHTVELLSISESIPDVQKHNNYYYKGKTSRWKIRPFASLNTSEYKNINLLPAIGFNQNNGFMLGLVAHNITLPSHKFQFLINPMYGFHSHTFNGSGFLNYNHYTPHSKGVHHIEFLLSGKSFGLNSNSLNIDKPVTNRYIKIAPEVVFIFRKPYDRSPVERQLSLKGYYIKEQKMEFNIDTNDSLYRPTLGGYEDNLFLTIDYNHSNYRTFNPYHFTVGSEVHKDYLKLSVEGQLKVDYHYKNAALYIRGFVGKMFPLNATSYDHYRYRFAGTFTESNDYLYDYTIIARSQNTGFGSQQIHIKDGGMKIQTLMYAQPLGMSDDVLASVNLASDIPIKGLPIKVFADIMTFSNAKKINPSGNAFLWDAGVEIDLWGVGSLYVPIFYSQDYKDYVNSIYPKNRFLNTITFKINFNQIKWHKPMETIPVLKKYF